MFSKTNPMIFDLSIIRKSSSFDIFYRNHAREWLLNLREAGIVDEIVMDSCVPELALSIVQALYALAQSNIPFTRENVKKIRNSGSAFYHSLSLAIHRLKWYKLESQSNFDAITSANIIRYISEIMSVVNFLQILGVQTNQANFDKLLSNPTKSPLLKRICASIQFIPGGIKQSDFDMLIETVKFCEDIDEPMVRRAILAIMENARKEKEKALSDEGIAEFFNKHLEDKVNTISISPYPLERDGGINPALKIFSANNQNTFENGRWEIFVVLIDELRKVGLRSGVKSDTWDYNNLRVTEQFNFSLFPPVTTSEIKDRLLRSRSGHPSLALDFKQLDHDVFRTLPVFTGGWLIRNDLLSQKRLQVYWSSGRYSRDLSFEQTHLLELCVAFNLMTEYGKDFKVEFYPYRSITMENFIEGRAFGGKGYDWKLIVEEVHQQIESVNSKDRKFQPGIPF